MSESSPVALITVLQRATSSDTPITDAVEEAMTMIAKYMVQLGMKR